MTADKIIKIFASLAIITLPLPFIFAREYVITYSMLGDITYTTPRIILFVIPLFFFILMVITKIWNEELDEWFKNKFGL